MTRRGWIALIAAALLVAAFAYQNRFERAAITLGPISIYAVPLVILLLAAFLLGMAAMLLLSLPVDRRNRELLSAHGLLGSAPSAPRCDVTDPVAAPSTEQTDRPSPDQAID